MKNLNRVAKASQKIEQEDRSTWLSLYYSFDTQSVYIKSGAGRHFVTFLIRPNAPEEIESAIERWLRL